MSEADSRRERLRKVIFEAETRPGRVFDVTLLILIAASVVALMLETVEPINARFGVWLK
jgi:voltage-gated potassium channel